MEESLTSVSDARITSLITTSITDMVRQEVGKIMQELNMPVCTEAIDRIIAENLDKEVEKQNVVKTYKKRVNEHLNQYKCIEKSADPDEVVFTNLKKIESRVKKLEDFVLQNLIQRPQLMQDLARRSVDSLFKKCESSAKELQSVNMVKVQMTQKDENIDNIQCIGNNNNSKSKPTLLNLDDLIKVIKECPETQDSFDIFQTAAERIKTDLERFIQNYKSSLNESPRRKGRSIKIEDISKTKEDSESKDTQDSPKVNEDAKKTEMAKNDDNDTKKTKDTVEIKNFRDCFSPGSSDTQIGPLKIESPDDPIVQQPEASPNDTATEKLEDKVVDLVAEAVETTNSQTLVVEHTVELILPTEEPSSQEDQNTANITNIPLGDGGTKVVSQKPTSALDILMDTRSPRECKECRQRLKFTHERIRTSAIDDDIKWKLDKILDKIGDFCNRSKVGRETKSEPETKATEANYIDDLKPGTSTECAVRRQTAIKSKRETPFKITATSKDERKNIDKMMDHIRHMGYLKKHVVKVKEFVVTDAKMKPKVVEQPKIKLKKPIEQRKSVEDFKSKWGTEYKNWNGKTSAETSKPKPSPIPPRTIEIVAKHQIKRKQTPELVIRKSSTTLMLESIDKFARSTAKTNKISKALREAEDYTWVYSRRAPPLHPPNANTNMAELPRTKVLYHNYKM